MRRCAFLVVVTLSSFACAPPRRAAYPPLDPDRPVLIDRDGYKQDGHPVSRVELDAQLLRQPDAQDRLAWSYRSRFTANLLYVLSIGSFGYFCGVLNQGATTRSAGLWTSGGIGAASAFGWAYYAAKSDTEYREAVETYNSRRHGRVGVPEAPAARPGPPPRAGATLVIGSEF